MINDIKNKKNLDEIFDEQEQEKYLKELKDKLTKDGKKNNLKDDFNTATENLLKEYKNHSWNAHKIKDCSPSEFGVDSFKDQLIKIFVDESGNIENKYSSLDKFKLGYAKLFGDKKNCQTATNSKILKNSIAKKLNLTNKQIENIDTKLDYIQKIKDGCRDEIIEIKIEGILTADYARRFEGRLDFGKERLKTLRKEMGGSISCRKFEETRNLTSQIMKTEKSVYNLEKERDNCSLRTVYCYERMKKSEYKYAKITVYERILSEIVLILKETKNTIENILEEYSKLGSPNDMKEYVVLCEHLEKNRQSLDNVFKENTGVLEYAEEFTDLWKKMNEGLYEDALNMNDDKEKKSRELYEKALKISKDEFLSEGNTAGEMGAENEAIQ